MADVNQLYQNVAASAEDVKNTYAGLPTFESNIQQNLVAQDPGLTSSLQGYTDKVAELFAHDKQIADNWSTSQVPTNLQPEGFMEDPYAKSMASASLYAQKGKETAKALNLYETRKNFLGNIVDKALKVYEAGIKGKEMDYKAAKDEFDNALKLAQLEETKRSNLASEAIARGKLSNVSETGTPVDSWTDSKVKTEFIKTYGANAYNNIGATQTDRLAAARALLGMAVAGEDFNAKDLMSDSQIKGRDKADDLLSKLYYAENMFTGKSGPGGTGPLAGIPPAIISGKNTKELRTALSGITPEKIKELSGVAVSDKEYERLADLLPSKWQSEEENLRRITEMKKILQIGMEMQNKAAMYNISLNDAYDRFGKDTYANYGVEYKISKDGSGNTIKVIELKTGRKGSIPESEYDPTLYQKI